MEPTMDVGVGPASGAKPGLGPVVQIDAGRIREHLDEVVRSTVEEMSRAEQNQASFFPPPRLGFAKYEAAHSAPLNLSGGVAGFPSRWGGLRRTHSGHSEGECSLPTKPETHLMKQLTNRSERAKTARRERPDSRHL
jgi:hypothetical protein